MILPRWAREFYEVAPDTTPTLPTGTTWQASFDDAVTWVPGALVNGFWQWLVAGPDFTPADGDPTPYTVITGYTVPWLRFTAAPEVGGIRGVPIELARKTA